MLDYKPQKYIKYWKISLNDEGNQILELITNDTRYLKLENQYVLIWNLVDGFRTIEEIINILKEVYPQNNPDELEKLVLESLKQLDEAELIILDWNPFG